MNYYILKNDLDEDVIGKSYPQVDCLTLFQAQLLNSWHLFNPAPDLSFELRGGAKLTDVLTELTINSRGFLISPKVREVLDSFHLMQHQYFPATVMNKGFVHNYSWLHLCEPSLADKINYEKSIFYRTEYTFRVEEVKIDSFTHYQELKSEDKAAVFGVELDKIVLSDEFDRNLDLFTFLPFDSNIYVSERLKKALGASNIQGFRFKSTGKLIYTHLNRANSA